jgi:hypothetical protein
MFKATLPRIFAFAKANSSHLAPSLCERIGDDPPASFLLFNAGQGSQEEKEDFLQLVCIYIY